MKFEVYEIGNRIAIKTIKKQYSKVTHLRVDEAKRVLNKMNRNNWEIIILDDNIKMLL